MKRKIRVIAATMALAIAMNICMPVYALAMPSSESEEAPQSPNSITNSEVDQDLQTIAGEPIEVQEDISEDNVESTPVPESAPEPTETPVPQADSAAENTVTVGETATPEQSKEYPAVYQDGAISLYTYEQLCAVGSSQPVLSGDAVQMGSGEAVLDDQGNAVTYAPDATYRLMADIPLDSQNIWTLPEGFTGRFVSDPVEDTAPLYDSQTDTIYVYNNYQLLTIASANAAQEPVMSGDIHPEQFGVGNFVYAQTQDENDETAQYLTYDHSHKYLLSRNFTEQMPEMIATMAANGTVDQKQLSGRMHIGQVYADIDGTRYILIGNAKQLEAIGTDAQVTPMLFVRTEVKIVGGLLGSKSTIVPYYPGDADFNVTSFADTGIANSDIEDEALDFQYFNQDTVPTELWNPDFDDKGLLSSVVSILGDVLSGILSIVASADSEIVGLKGDNTDSPSIGASSGGLFGNDRAYMSFTEVKETYQDLKYSSDANYIIFRDIDLNELNSDTSQANWTPLTFSGTMIGAKAAPGQQLTDGTTITATERPVISNLRVFQDSPLDVGKTMGVGFFATLNSDSFAEKNTVSVSNLILDSPVVHTTTTEKTYDQTLINGLLSGLGGLLDDLLDTLLGPLGIQIGMQDVLTNLLNARQADPTALATGAFAGRVKGNVRISNCDVIKPDVYNVNSVTGGFVGYSEGETIYATESLGKLVDALAFILNGIPGLGLGDIITILLDNGLDIGKLAPTGYATPEISNCHVSQLSGTLGAASSSFIGGFSGELIGTKVEDCSITASDYTIQSSSYGGGFAGLARDAQIDGLLSDVGIELLRVCLPQSLLLNCSVSADTLSVSGGEYLGGFVGALANSYAVNDTVSATLTVAGEKQEEPSTTGSSIGGFAGIATTGWVTNLGAGEGNNNSLLGDVKGILTGLLSQNPGQAQMLLSLVGVAPSAIMGCQVNAGGGKTVAVSGVDYVGGMLGNGDGVYLMSSSSDSIGKVSALQSLLTDKSVPVQNSVVNGLASVTASGDYAGGIAGSVEPASVAGLLNDTIGVASFLGFDAENVSVTGDSDGYTVSAARYCGGAFGEAVGGNATSVTVDNIQSVTAQNYAGGFVGVCGPGDLAGTGGLTLHLLGLNNLLKIDSLLSVIPGVKVELSNCTVSGSPSGFKVTATDADTSVEQDYTAGGFAAYCNSTKLTDCSVNEIGSVTAADKQGFAGGFVGISKTGGLADLANEEGNLEVGGSLISVENLLGTVAYMVPTYTDCTVTYVDGGCVHADVAGGFVGEMQSGKVNNNGNGEDDYYAVYNIDRVEGGTYAGGFGGIVQSGALADAVGGISILGGSGINISIGDLLQLVEAYVPYVEYAGVKSLNSFTVTAETLKETDAHSGSAGGFIGYASGAQISTCDVTNLKHTTVTAPADLETADASTYFGDSSAYAVKGGRYAGGFIGCMDIGSAASVGKGLSILGDTINVADMLSVLNVVVTTVEHSDVTGSAGGYSVLASQTDNTGAIGHAGGYAGAVYGGHIQDSNAHNFEYIIGQISAGGYVGEMEPGNVANLLGDASILNSLIDVDAALASVLSAFVPTIRNSSTDAVPCGGVVRAQACSSGSVQRGMAGGYVGHNMGGSIWGLNTDPWKTATDAYTGPTSLCKAERIRSVYGAEYAGGYTGFMEAADTANVGGLNLLGGLVKVSNLLSLLDVIYPGQENTAVYGPLANLDWQTWNSWVEYVGQYGGYGYELAQSGKVSSQDELNAKLANYIYGFNVVAGRTEKDITLPNLGGDAGGYVGLMRSGSLINCMAYDVKTVKALHGAGGYAGSMETGGAANFGSVSILVDLNLKLGQLVDVAQLFVPAIRNSSVYGYTSGMTVEATGNPTDDTGYAGGYVGCSYGAQIQMRDDDLPNSDADSVTWTGTDKYPAPVASCDVHNLRRVTGQNAIGGYVGLASAASLASVNTNASDGVLQGILNQVITNAGNLVDLLPATVTTIHKASVSPADTEWGFVVDGTYQDSDGITKYAPYAGGFVGFTQSAVLGEKDATEPTLKVDGLRSVDGGLYAGGFFGLADIAAVAEISGTNSDGSPTNILGQLANLGSIDVLDILRCYVYHATVNGVAEGFVVQAHRSTSEGIMDEERQTGCAGGFGGGLLGGTIRNCAVTNLSTVQGLNYTGGFIGHMGKSGVVDIDSVEVLGKLLGATVGAIDLFGSQVFDSSVTGIAAGAVVKAASGSEPISGGFVGYSDLGRIEDSTVNSLKKVTSDQIAGGFIGKTDMNYIVSLQIQSSLLEGVLRIVDSLIQTLYLGSDGLASIDLVDINLGILKVNVLDDGNTLGVELLGLPITVALSKAADNPEQQTDVAIITIGDSVVRLPCNKSGLTEEGKAELENVEINLIKGNRTELDSCSVNGVNNGYDVFGGGATQDEDGTNGNGIAGGFVGYNHEGKVSNSKMVLCDVVRGTADKVGPFSGYNDLKSVYWFNTIKNIEGDNNTYSVYRPYADDFTQATLQDGTVIASAAKDSIGGVEYNRYEITHLATFDSFADLDGAKENGTTSRELLAYVSSAKAVLMLDADSPDNQPSIVPEPGVMGDPCSEKVDLTIQKVWDDWFNFGQTRPENGITLTVYRQAFTLQDASKVDEDVTTYPSTESGKVWAPALNENGEIVSPETYQTLNLTEKNQESPWSAVWSTILQDTPVYEFADKNSNGTRDEGEEITAYYVYTVEEVVPDGYSVSYHFYNPTDADDYELTVTNKLNIPLPDTGGAGDILFVVVGVGILLLAVTVRKRRRSGKGMVKRHLQNSPASMRSQDKNCL